MESTPGRKTEEESSKAEVRCSSGGRLSQTPTEHPCLEGGKNEVGCEGCC